MQKHSPQESDLVNIPFSSLNLRCKLEVTHKYFFLFNLAVFQINILRRLEKNYLVRILFLICFQVVCKMRCSPEFNEIKVGILLVNMFSTF